mmetsp:Transcript_29775/g.61444  ORF Transcript_29775/g.61444 Transcript_29775/m.61444 type:complete len:318 (+) Transcript_29775:566-1519(+)
MMITTKGQARFHERFPSGHLRNTGGSTMSFGNENFHSTSGGICPVTLSNGNKRLASCREELELSWFSSSDFPSGACAGYDGGGKRRRTQGFCRMVSGDSSKTDVGKFRITPTNRSGTANDFMDDNTPSSRVVKAGWYYGSVDSQGLRHGRGKTEHDDGTEFEGLYVYDTMEGMGRFKFVTERQLVPVPNTSMGCVHIHRVIEKSFEGNFSNDKPRGKGIHITKITDSVPQGTCGHNGWSGQVKSIEVIYDVGYHNSEGTPIGEGVRFSYCKKEDDMAWEEECIRLFNGKSVNVRLTRNYGEWLCECLQIQPPVTPSW